MTMRLIGKYIAVLACMGLIFWFSAQGHESSSGQSMEVVRGVHQLTGVTLPEVLVRKTAHVTIYALLGVLLAWLVLEYTVQWRRVWLVATGVVLLYATSDELHQLVTGGRSGQVSDVLLDTLAGAVVIGVFLSMRRIYLQKQQ